MARKGQGKAVGKATGKGGARPGAKGGGVLVVAKNRAAHRRWSVEETFEAGLVLTGTEVKAIREGKVQLADAYAVPRGGELFLLNLHIGPYGPAGPYQQHEPRRSRKLLLHGREIARLIGQTEQKGYSLVPLDVHLRGGRVKIQLGLCRGKKLVDRREDLKAREADREVARAMRRR